jgi:hypothetical protein
MPLLRQKSSLDGHNFLNLRAFKLIQFYVGCLEFRLRSIKGYA